MKVNEKTINNIKQNKIKYLVKDFKALGIPEDTTREILLKRGINKWLYNRMRFINLKDELKQKTIAYLYSMKLNEKYHGKDSPIYKQLLGMMLTTVHIRKQIRKICHNSRWVFPE